MTDLIRAVLPGIGAGGLYALVGLSIVVIYRGSGLLNFASGGFALFGAIVYVELTGGPGVPIVAAIAAAVVAGAAAGASTHAFVLRPMRRASPLAKVIATLAVLAFVLEAARKHYGDRPRFVPSFLPSRPVVIFGAGVPSDRLIVLGVTVVLALGLWAVYRWTGFGRLTTGVAENERAMAALGWSPHVVSTANWAVGGALCGLAGVMLTSVVSNSLSPNALTLAVVPALAAALIGGFSSFPATLCGGLLIGVLEALSLRYVSVQGAASAIPFVVVIVVMVVRGRAVPLRSHLADRLPRIGPGRVRPSALVGAVVLAVASLHVFSDTWAVVVTTSTIAAILCLSLVVVIGYCGQLSLAQLALAGVAALCTAQLSARGVPLPFVAVAAVVVTVLAGLIVALPAVRVRGVSLAVVTLSLSLVISAMVLSNPAWTKGEDHFGFRPDLILTAPSIAGIDLTSSRYPHRYATLGIVVLVLAVLALANLRRGRTSRRMIAVRANERAASSIGINVVATKLHAFGIGAGLAGLAGVVIAYRYPTVQFDQFDVLSSINTVLLAVIGGIGSIVGGIAGGVNVGSGVGEQTLSAFFDVKGWFTVIAPVALIIVLLTQPDGVAFPPQQLAKHRRARAPRGQTDEPSHRTSRAVRPTPRRTPPAVQAVEPRPFLVEGLTVRFGAVEAVSNVSFSIVPGEIVGLIGPNGAGKTSFVDAVSGLEKAASGRVMLGGVDVTHASASRRARHGLGRSFQSLELFDDMTVRNNVRVAAEQRARGGYVTDLMWPRSIEASDTELAAIDEFDIAGDLDLYPTQLPYARRRLVAIARAVAASPSVLMLDEPAAGLDEASTGELARLVKRLAREWGMGILLIEHDVSFVFDLCDRIVVMNFGEMIAEGVPHEVRTDPVVISAYLGGSPAVPVPAGPT